MDRIVAGRARISAGDGAGLLSDWAKLEAVDGVRWTALPLKFGTEERKPAMDEVVNYLSGLLGEECDRA